jgi:DNA-binding NtrC family response regulator
MESSIKSPYPERPIVVIDDEPAALQGVALHLRVAGFTNVKTFTSAREAASLWKHDQCATVILDVIMPDCNGLDVLKEIKFSAPDIPVVMVTGVNEIDTAVNCLKNGAHDYLLKPLESERLIATVTNMLRIAELERDYSALAECMLAKNVRNPGAFAHICGQGESTLRLFKYVESVGPTSHPVLITGETGVGKELFAQAIHTVSGRTGKFVTVNIAGLDDALFSDTLFGHVRGAFTGADSARAGLVESASGGTVFLDEIGDLSMQSQVKLLRLIQEKEYRQLGSDAQKPCDARIVAATCRTLDELNASAIFRKDLYYRLRTHHIHVPPLRERKEDLPVLIAHFVEKAAKELDRGSPHVPSDLFALLSAYHFPGNVRELEAMIFDAMSNTHNGKLSLKSIHETIGTQQKATHSDSGVTFHAQLPSLKKVEHLLIQEACTRASGNQTVAAELIGITRQTLAYHLKQMGS